MVGNPGTEAQQATVITRRNWGGRFRAFQDAGVGVLWDVRRGANLVFGLLYVQRQPYKSPHLRLAFKQDYPSGSSNVQQLRPQL